MQDTKARETEAGFILRPQSIIDLNAVNGDFLAIDPTNAAEGEESDEEERLEDTVSVARCEKGSELRERIAEIRLSMEATSKDGKLGVQGLWDKFRGHYFDMEAWVAMIRAELPIWEIVDVLDDVCDQARKCIENLDDLRSLLERRLKEEPPRPQISTRIAKEMVTKLRADWRRAESWITVKRRELLEKVYVEKLSRSILMVTEDTKRLADQMRTLRNGTLEAISRFQLQHDVLAEKVELLCAEVQRLPQAATVLEKNYGYMLRAWHNLGTHLNELRQRVAHQRWQKSFRTAMAQLQQYSQSLRKALNKAAYAAQNARTVYYMRQVAIEVRMARTQLLESGSRLVDVLEQSLKIELGRGHHATSINAECGAGKQLSREFSCLKAEWCVMEDELPNLEAHLSRRINQEFNEGVEGRKPAWDRVQTPGTTKDTAEIHAHRLSSGSSVSSDPLTPIPNSREGSFEGNQQSFPATKKPLLPPMPTLVAEESGAPQTTRSRTPTAKQLSTSFFRKPPSRTMRSETPNLPASRLKPPSTASSGNRWQIGGNPRSSSSIGFHRQTPRTPTSTAPSAIPRCGRGKKQMGTKNYQPGNDVSALDREIAKVVNGVDKDFPVRKVDSNGHYQFGTNGKVLVCRLRRVRDNVIVGINEDIRAKGDGECSVVARVDGGWVELQRLVNGKV